MGYTRLLSQLVVLAAAAGSVFAQGPAAEDDGPNTTAAPGAQPTSPATGGAASDLAGAVNTLSKVVTGITGLTFPTSFDVEQCAIRKLLRTGTYLLGDLKEGDGCVLQNEEAFELFNSSSPDYAKMPFNASDWTVEIKRPFKNDTVVRIVSPLNRPVHFCYSMGSLGLGGAVQEVPASTEKPLEEIPADQADTAIDNAGTNLDENQTAAANLTFEPEIAFARNVKLPQNVIEKIDKGIMSYYLIVRNVPNPFDTVGLASQETFTQTIKMAWLDEKGEFLLVTNTTEADATKGLIWSDEIPEGARGLSMAFITDYPFYAVGQISLTAYPSALEFHETAQKLFNVCFFAGCAFILLAPAILILEEYLKKRPIKLRIVDLVHVQGPRYMRAIVFTVMMALLYFMFQWVRAVKPKDDGSYIPLFGGISSGFFAQRPNLKTIKSLIFIASFVAVGLFFWPLFVCYAHAADGSRTASVLGILIAANLIGMRTCIEYLNTQPTKSFERRILQEIPEVLCYVGILVYFSINAVSPTFILTTYRKTYFKDVIHVSALLRRVHLPPKPTPPPPKTGIAALLAKLQPVDNRPIWLRGRAKTSMFQEFKIFVTTFRMPVRLMAAIMMMGLFTYFVLISQLVPLLDSNAKLSCKLSSYGPSLIETFASVFELMGEFTGAQSFGSPLADTIRDLTLQIRDETEGGVVEEMFNLLLGCVVASMILAALLLVYNIIDFCMQVREDMRKLRVGDYSRVENYAKMATSQAVQFMGTQIGYAYMGSLYLMTILLMICFMIALFVKFRFFRELFWRFVMQNGLIFISIAVGLVLSLVQKFIVEIFFVAKLREAPEEHPDAENVTVDKKGEIVISTKFWLQRVIGYNQVDFFFLFPNLITGLLSFLSNLIKMILGSALYAYRLDKKTEYTLPLVGSKSGVYFSWLLQDHHHTNPVLLVFLKLLSDWHAHHTPLVEKSRDPHRRRIATKWHLAYTLVNNPILSKYRKHIVRQTYLREYIAHTEAPLLREQELQRVRAENARIEETKGELRAREIEIWKAATEGGFGRDALAKKMGNTLSMTQYQVITPPSTGLTAGGPTPPLKVSAPATSPQPTPAPVSNYAVPGSAYDIPYREVYQQPQTPAATAAGPQLSDEYLARQQEARARVERMQYQQAYQQQAQAQPYQQPQQQQTFQQQQAQAYQQYQQTPAAPQQAYGNETRTAPPRGASRR
ncbi:hypothetical protein HDU96_001975 [Phlyctochytrium bullatum]|nr:hypothetical protein HDU96_001975 [Phlyctochytrium bullatum]